ncbi:hypothetical protein GCM10023322_79950 [Rugosimonospora acidiphila]|uniref:Uncharacterized protein n=1 Tax=Rugosimonospora acidiphila TaxID=556531 RepID=A0ABP9SUG2_9ACTN
MSAQRISQAIEPAMASAWMIASSTTVRRYPPEVYGRAAPDRTGRVDTGRVDTAEVGTAIPRIFRLLPPKRAGQRPQIIV